MVLSFVSTVHSPCYSMVSALASVSKFLGLVSLTSCVTHACNSKLPSTTGMSTLLRTLVPVKFKLDETSNSRLWTRNTFYAVILVICYCSHRTVWWAYDSHSLEYPVMYLLPEAADPGRNGQRSVMIKGGFSFVDTGGLWSVKVVLSVSPMFHCHYIHSRICSKCQRAHSRSAIALIG